GTIAGQAIVTDNGVTIIGYTDLPGRLPAQASQLYGTNLVNLLKLLAPGKDGQLQLDLDDVVQRSMTVAHHGEVLWPPPPVQVSAAASSTVDTATQAPMETAKRRNPYALAAIALAVLFGVVAIAPSRLIGNFTVFALAVVIGF